MLLTVIIDDTQMSVTFMTNEAPNAKVIWFRKLMSIVFWENSEALAIGNVTDYKAADEQAREFLEACIN